MSDLEYWEHRWTDNLPQKPNAFARRAWAFLEDKHCSTLLDLGCGDGKDAIFFHIKGLRVTAIDFSQTGLSKLKAKIPEIQTIQQDIQNIGFSNNSFDVIYAHLSLQYFDDATTASILRKLHGILVRGGFIFIKCKSVEDPLYGQGEKIDEHIYYLKHVRHFFSKEYMAEKLKDFTIISIKKTASVYHGYKSAFIEAIATK